MMFPEFGLKLFNPKSTVKMSAVTTSKKTVAPATKTLAQIAEQTKIAQKVKFDADGFDYAMKSLSKMKSRPGAENDFYTAVDMIQSARFRDIRVKRENGDQRVEAIIQFDPETDHGEDMTGALAALAMRGMGVTVHTEMRHDIRQVTAKIVSSNDTLNDAILDIAGFEDDAAIHKGKRIAEMELKEAKDALERAELAAALLQQDKLAARQAAYAEEALF